MTYDKLSSPSERGSADGFPSPQRMQIKPLLVLAVLAGGCILCFAAAFTWLAKVPH